jgi:RHS repeat-associated protein
LQVQSSEALYQIMVARYYASSLGRFMASDPLMGSARGSDPQSWNRYTYALNNPMRFIDTTGLDISNPGEDYKNAWQASRDHGLGAMKTLDEMFAEGWERYLDWNGDEETEPSQSSESSLDEMIDAIGTNPLHPWLQPAPAGGPHHLSSTKQGKGERRRTAKPDNPRKHARPSKEKPGQWEVKDPHTGKWVLKPPGWTPENASKYVGLPEIIGLSILGLLLLLGGRGALLPRGAPAGLLAPGLEESNQPPDV